MWIILKETSVKFKYWKQVVTGFIIGLTLSIILGCTNASACSNHTECVSLVKTVYTEFVDTKAEGRIQPLHLMLALAETESSMRPNAVGYNKEHRPVDFGLFQLNRWWLIKFEKEELKDPMTNACIAMVFVNHLMNRYRGDLNAVIQAYNLGETKYNRGIRAPSYLATVKMYMRIYKNDF